METQQEINERVVDVLNTHNKTFETQTTVIKSMQQMMADMIEANAELYRQVLLIRAALFLAFLGLAFFMMMKPAEAQEVHVQFHGASKHWGPKPTSGWNEKNWGLGLRYQFNPDWGVQAGFYKNSHGRNTNYVIADWTPILDGRIGVFAGVASGYTAKYPIVGGLMYREQFDRLSITFRVIPRVAENRAGVMAIEAGWRIK